jgi:hypothetical protein
MEKKINLEGANSKYLDWVDSLKIIPQKSDKNILEFGCGLGTQYLCNNFKNVYSFEVYGNDSWYVKTVELLKPWDNWNGSFYTADELGLVPNMQNIYKNPSSRDESVFRTPNGFYDKLNEFVDLSTIDVGFVDHSVCMRGETVNYLMDNDVPIIFAHDTKHGYETYGWGVVYQRDDYEVVNVNSGQGVTYWIKK